MTLFLREPNSNAPTLCSNPGGVANSLSTPGLGLSVVYGMIEQHAGFVQVTSETGQGARFEVYLPHIPELAGESVYECMEMGGFETILVVDDEPGALRLVAETLRGSGYTVLETGDSSEALEMANREKAPRRSAVDRCPHA